MRTALVRLGLLVIVAAAAAGAWGLWLRAAPPSPDPPTPRLYAVADDDIVRVAIETGEGGAAFVRGRDGWGFAAEPAMPVNRDRWGGIVLLLSGPRVDRTLPAPADPAAYGLDAPWTVEVGLADGDRVTVRIGAPTPDGRHRYARVDGESDVRLVNAPWVEALARLVSAPPLPYWFYRIDPSLVRVFEVETADGAVTFLLGLAPTGAGPSARVVVGDAARDLDDAEREELRGIVGGPSALRLLPPPGADALGDLGLAPPRALIRLSYELPVPLEHRRMFSTVYAVGAETPDGAGTYVVSDEAPALLAFGAAWTDGVRDLAARYLSAAR